MVYKSEIIDSPITIGVLHPAIVLPAKKIWECFDLEEKKSILRHNVDAAINVVVIAAIPIFPIFFTETLISFSNLLFISSGFSPSLSTNDIMSSEFVPLINFTLFQYWTVVLRWMKRISLLWSY